MHPFNQLTVKILNFFQTSANILFWSSLLALILSLISFPVWQEVFTENHMPVEVEMAAPGSTYVKMYWDNPETHPDAYEQIKVKPTLQSGLWQVKIEALGQKNPSAQASQVWILDVSTPEHALDWTKVKMEPLPWEFWRGQEKVAPAEANVAMTQGDQGQSLTASIEGHTLTVRLLRHPWSGKVRVTVNDKEQEFDLFAPQGSPPEILTFESVEIGDKTSRTYQIKGVDTSWHRLKFVAEDSKDIKIKSLRVRGEYVAIQQTGTVILPYRFFNRDTVAIIASVLSFVWLTVMIVSMIHVWQGWLDRRFSTITWAFFFSATLAVFWTLVFYPGLLTVDSINQWVVARSLLDGNKGGYFWFGPTLSLFMAASFRLSQEYGLFTFIQLFLYYFSSILLIQFFFDKKLWIATTCLFVANPIIWNQSALVGRDTFTAAVINLSLLSLLNLSKTSQTQHRRLAALVVIFFISCILMLALRPNSLTVLPALMLITWKLLPTVRWKLITVGFCLLSILCSQWFINTAITTYQKTKIDIASASVIWEHIGTLKQINDLQVAKKYNIDFVGNTRLALEKYDCISHDSLIFSEPSPLEIEKIITVGSKRIKSTFFSLATTYPIKYLKNKLCIYGTVLGFNNEVGLRIIPIKPYIGSKIGTNLAKMIDLDYQPKIRNWGNYLVQSFAETFPSSFPFFTPWTIILAGLLVWWGLTYALKISSWALSSLMLVALAYYGGYFILTPGFHFRYFFPSYTLILIFILCGLAKVICYLKDKYYPSKLKTF